jgi:hypothetical protein
MQDFPSKQEVEEVVVVEVVLKMDLRQLDLVLQA